MGRGVWVAWACSLLAPCGCPVFADQALTQARAAQSLLMTETVTVTTTTRGEWDEGAQEYPEVPVTHYTDVARVTTVAARDAGVTPAGVTDTPAPITVTTPWDAPTLPDDAAVHVDSSSLPNPLVGSTVYITGEDTSHLATARHYVARRTR